MVNFDNINIIKQKKSKKLLIICVIREILVLLKHIANLSKKCGKNRATLCHPQSKQCIANNIQKFCQNRATKYCQPQSELRIEQQHIANLSQNSE